MITLRYTTLARSSLDGRSARRRDLYLTTDNTPKREAPCSWQDSNGQSSKRAALDPRLRSCCHWDWQL